MHASTENQASVWIALIDLSAASDPRAPGGRAARRPDPALRLLLSCSFRRGDRWRRRGVSNGLFWLSCRLTAVRDLRAWVERPGVGPHGVGQFQQVSRKLLHAVLGRGGLGEPADLEVQVARVAEEPIGVDKELAAETGLHHHPGVRSGVGWVRTRFADSRSATLTAGLSPLPRRVRPTPHARSPHPRQPGREPATCIRQIK